MENTVANAGTAASILPILIWPKLSERCVGRSFTFWIRMEFEQGAQCCGMLGAIGCSVHSGCERYPALALILVS